MRYSHFQVHFLEASLEQDSVLNARHSHCHSYAIDFIKKQTQRDALSCAARLGQPVEQTLCIPTVETWTLPE